MRNNTLTLITDIVAVYRLTKLVTDDKLTEDIREAIFSKFPPNSSKLGYLLSCGWCTSIWAGLIVFGLRRVSPSTADYLSSVLAASAVAGIAYDRHL